MAKLKSSETLSLDKSKQKKVVKQTKKLKKKIEDGKISIKRPRRSFTQENLETRGLVYIGHIPHGFYEDEMKNYFKQFGAVTNVKVCRSNKSGNSKGFGYVEFSNSDVAKIAAETMNNYLMFKKRLVAEFVPFEKRPKHLFKGRSSTVQKYSAKVRLEKQRFANSKVDEKTHLKRTSTRLSRLNKKLQRLKDLGIDYDFKPVNVPERPVKEVLTTVEEMTYKFEQDPYDSDIEVKVSLKTKTPQKTPKKGKRTSIKADTLAKTKVTPKKSPKLKLESPKVTRKRKLETPKKTPKKVTTNVEMEIITSRKSLTKKTPKKTVTRQTSSAETTNKKTKIQSPKKTPTKVASKKVSKPTPKSTPKQKVTKRKSIPK